MNKQPKVNRLFGSPQEHTRDRHERPESEATSKAPGIYAAIDDSDDEDDFPPSKRRKDEEILDKREEIHNLKGVILARDREILRLKQTNHDLRAEVREKDNALKRQDSKLRTPEINNDGDNYPGASYRRTVKALKGENMVLLSDVEFFQAANEKSELRVSELEAQINAFKEKVAKLKGCWDELKDHLDDDVFTEPRTSYEEYEMRDLVDSSLCTLIDIIGDLEKPMRVDVERRDKDVISMNEDSGDDM
ncbi:hypothetical protein V8F06_013991 [Rhypophila decipiens]